MEPENDLSVSAVIAEPAPPQGSLLSLVSKYKPASDSPEQDYFFAKLPKGDRIKCKRVTDADTVASLGRRAQKWATEQAAKDPSAWMETWRPYYTDKEETLCKVWLLSELCLEPDFHRNHLNCLILAKTLGPIFLGILEQINLASANLLKEEFDEFEDQGNA